MVGAPQLQVEADKVSLNLLTGVMGRLFSSKYLYIEKDFCLERAINLIALAFYESAWRVTGW